jgi:hypothetical protein
MKKLLFLLSIMLLFSCEKQETCKICVTTTTFTPVWKYSMCDPVVEETIFEACGEELERIDGEDVTAPTYMGEWHEKAIMTRKTKCN